MILTMFQCWLQVLPVKYRIVMTRLRGRGLATVSRVREMWWRVSPPHLHHHHLLLLLLLLVWESESDQRCLLEGGGSTDTFFVREDSRQGEEVGRLRVTGEKMAL